jgi:PEP-CTERM/exosortase A-associated glycosyltransferase
MAKFDFSVYEGREWTYYAAYLKRFTKNPKKIFEMGSGTGLFLEACRMNDIEAIGCELEDEGVAAAKSRGLQVYKHDLADPLTFAASDSFDAVFCNQVIEHVDSRTQENIIKEAYRILKPGGEFLVQSPCRHYEGARKDKYHINLLTPSELKALLEKHGFWKCNMGYNQPQEISEIPKDVMVSIWRRYRPDVLSQTTTILAEKPDYLNELIEQQRLKKALEEDVTNARAELTATRTELTAIRTELEKERRVRESISFQLGQALIRPLRRPGGFLLRLLNQVLARSPEWLKGAILRITSKSRVLSSLRVMAVRSTGQRSRLDSIMEGPDLAEQKKLFHSFLYRFREMAVSRPSCPLVIISTGNKRIGEDNRGNRCMMFTRELATIGIPVIYVYYRFRGGREFAPYEGGYLLQIPNDFFHTLAASIAAWDTSAQKLLICSIPDKPSSQEIGLFRRQGWKVIYEARDDWEQFFRAGSSKWYDAEIERTLCREADFVTTVSVTLRNKMVAMGAHPERTFLVPNGVSREFLENAKASFAHRRSGYRGTGTVGYFGGLTGKWFDWDLLAVTAARRPHLRFEIIGFAEPESLNLPGNVVMLGAKNHEEIIGIASNWSLGIIPFKNTKLAEGVDPIKIYEYLALGLPCVSCWMPQIKDYPLTFTYRDDSRFEETLDMALKYTPSAEDWVQAESFVAGSTWDQRVRMTLSIAGIDISHTTTRHTLGSSYKGVGSLQIPPRKSPSEVRSKEQTALMILHYSLPYHSNGYTIRSQGLISGLKNTAWDVIPYTRPGYPLFSKYRGIQKKLDVSHVDGVTYNHLKMPNMRAMQRDYSNCEYYVEESAKAIVSLAIELCPSLIHAASNHLTALPALMAARRVGIPFIYEVRGLWEITEVSADVASSGTELFELKRSLEALVCKEADHVITLTKGIRDELVLRGVEKENISIVSNCVDIERFHPLSLDKDLHAKLGLSDAPTIGYIGSFVAYEGLDDLVRAASILKKRGIKFNLLFVGDGKAMDELRGLVEGLNLTREVFITGHVPFSDVEQYYSLIDIAAFPRKPLPVCEMVSPLKPLEAMAMGKVIVASSVDALQEIVIHGETGLVFKKGNVRDLADKLARVIKDKDLSIKLGSNGLNWVRENRPWKRAAKEVTDIYEDILSRTKVRASAESDSSVSLSKPAAQSTILVAGHDLKFIDRLFEEFPLHGYTVLLDKWGGHNQHDVAASRELLDKADIIICEWCLGNAVWYSQHKRTDQKLVIRFHLQEVDTRFPASVKMGNVHKVIFIAPHVQKRAISRFGWERWAREKLTLVPNYVDVSALDLPKADGAQYNLGICGIVPQRKRVDRALDILEILRRQEKRFQLHIKGKMPQEYPWMRRRREELQYYEGQMDRIKHSDLLKDAIHFDGWGDDMPEWYKRIGFVLSTSDFEGSHVTVAEGAASGGVPVLLRWEGADELYPPDWSHNSTDEAAAAILSIVTTGRFEETGQARQAHARKNFDIGRIARAWLEIIESAGSSIDKTDTPTSALERHEM